MVGNLAGCKDVLILFYLSPLYYSLCFVMFRSFAENKGWSLTDVLKDDQMLFYIWINEFALQRNSLSLSQP